MKAHLRILTMKILKWAVIFTSVSTIPASLHASRFFRGQTLKIGILHISYKQAAKESISV